jgi:phosphoribosylamine--glycine ligase / phosphoribosylformylglycinamidine cyclo-ligase
MYLHAGRPFAGMLFTGIMLTALGPKVLEYNARFGDPETQSLILLLGPDCDLAQVLLACAQGKLDTVEIAISPGYACNVCVASEGYPGPYRSGDVITIDGVPAGVHIFHVGTAFHYGMLQTAGGRVLYADARAESLHEAIRLAYAGIECIRFDGMQYRRDIGRAALEALD